MSRYLLASALLLAGPAHADWYEASTGHFVVYADEKPEKLKAFATNLERFDKAVRLRMDEKDAPIGKANRVTVYVVDDAGDVAKLAGKRGVAGFYHPRAGGSLAMVPRSTGAAAQGSFTPQAVLLHEYSHHLMWSLWPNTAYPTWYVEGFAEFFGTATFDKDQSVLLGAPPQYRANAVLAGNGFPLDKLLVTGTRELTQQQFGAYYGRSWLLINYLVYGAPARKSQLRDYMEAINHGKSPQEAATVFGDLRALDRELERYKRSQFPMMRINAAALPIGDVALRKLTPGEAATMAARIRSKNGVSRATAPEVYEAAKKAAAPYPDDRGAQLELAEAAYDARDLAAAEAAADRVIAADPKEIGGYLYKAMARIGVALEAHDRSPQSWNPIRKLIATANRLDPDDPRPLILFYRSFLFAGQKPSDNAKLGLATAFSLAPYDSALRFNTAAMYLRDGRKAEARALLAPLAYQPHGRMAEVAGRLLATIDASNAEAALKTLDGGAPDQDGDKENGGDGSGPDDAPKPERTPPA